MDYIEIRKITQDDNADVARIIRETLVEYGAPKVGTAYADPELDRMFETYNVPKSVYFVLTENGNVIGSAGIAPLANADESICELQKMYFSKQARGRGFGKMMMAKCLEAARDFGYEKCYLETLPYMNEAQALYRKSGFRNIERPLGGTGHTSCTVWMLRELELTIDN
ncbi:MAG: GNAT family N-acetyltransferase [Flavobacterium sp.]|uniref:GNAT family N-acetyltransferase n=1 Tax=Flavobacterium sp. TaxID=239 RepID=UPI001223DC81|nr:GNAT family N-acetyltransferase [Flavobacterium sp.]RZJ64153.1 MAG: GNAT family N-acetyltransferase [Flavobacterium sp.]